MCSCAGGPNLSKNSAFVFLSKQSVGFRGHQRRAGPQIIGLKSLRAWMKAWEFKERLIIHVCLGANSLHNCSNVLRLIPGIWVLPPLLRMVSGPITGLGPNAMLLAGVCGQQVRQPVKGVWGALGGRSGVGGL